MKKTLSIMLCLLMIFSSVSFVFADFSAQDSNNLTTIKNSLTSGGGLYTIINNANQNLVSLCNLVNSQSTDILTYNSKTAARYLSDIYGAMFQSDGSVSHSITWWLKEAVLDLDNIVAGGTGSIAEAIMQTRNALVYYTSGGNAPQSWLERIWNSITTLDYNLGLIYNNTNTLVSDLSTGVGYLLGILGYQQNIESIISKSDSGKSFSTWSYPNSSTNYTLSSTTVSGDFVDFIQYGLMNINNNTINGLDKILLAGFNNYQLTQTATNWLTLGNTTFTPSSATYGLYNWLKNIQTPIARLAYVHASDEEIEAREKAAANQTAVVDNFIDSSGSGSASAFSFGDVASMSSGYTTNMNTDAQASGIWNIFNSNNFGWFSQETANQLDTTVSTRKGSSDFETPLLDQQIAEIYKELGVNVND